jgi:hypothetical protein
MYVAAVEAPKEKERRDKTQFFSTRIAGKTTCKVAVILFCKIFILSYVFDALLC